MRIQPWHVEFSVLGAGNIVVIVLERDVVVLEDHDCPGGPAWRVDLITGEATRVVRDYTTFNWRPL